MKAIESDAMGSLDVSSAKQQFFTLVDAISASHLPSFTIWLDAKLAEYKTIGQLKPDTEYESREQYPEWIAKALHQNLSFLFPDHTPTSLSSQNNVLQTIDASVQKRKQSRTSHMCSGNMEIGMRENGSNGDELVAAEADLVMVIKEEPDGSGPSDTPLSRAANTPLPGIRSTFSLPPELESNCTVRQTVPVSFSNPLESHATHSATSNTAPDQPVPRPLLSVTFDTNTNRIAETRKSECASSQRESVPLFSPSAVSTKLEASPPLSASFPEKPSAYSVTLPISAAPPALEPVDSREPSQTSEEAMQARDKATRQEASISSSSNTRDAASSQKPSAPKRKPAERRQSCAACGAEFYKPSELLMHERIHTGERPFTCSQCSAKFMLKHNLKTHMRTHTGERPFACSEYPARFSTASNLKVHVRLHTGERPSHVVSVVLRFLESII